MADPFILDPISTIVCLALLPYMDAGVKIGIVNNRIMFFQPTMWGRLHRSIYSWINPGCSKHSLYHLRLPIEQAIFWHGHKYEKMFEMAKAGLKTLKTAYQVHPTLGNVIETINSLLNIFDEDVSYEETEKDVRIRESWTEEELTAIYEWLCLLQKERKQYIVNSIYNHLCGKEKELSLNLRNPNF